MHSETPFFYCLTNQVERVCHEQVHSPLLRLSSDMIWLTHGSQPTRATCHRTCTIAQSCHWYWHCLLLLFLPHKLLTTFLFILVQIVNIDAIFHLFLFSGLCTAAAVATGESSNNHNHLKVANTGGSSFDNDGDDLDDNGRPSAAWPSNNGGDHHRFHTYSGNAKLSPPSSSWPHEGGGGRGADGYIPGPFFEPVFATNVSVLAGQAVLLQCRVMELGDRVVRTNISFIPIQEFLIFLFLFNFNNWSLLWNLAFFYCQFGSSWPNCVYK